MTRAEPTVRWPLLLLVLGAIGGLIAISLERLQVDSDVASTIPDAGQTLSDARRVMARGAALDRVVIDLSLDSDSDRIAPAPPPGDAAPPAGSQPAGDPERLTRAATWLEARLKDSGLFRQIGLGFDAGSGSRLYGLILDQLPALFDAEQLRREVAPLTRPAAVRGALSRNLARLAQLEGTGQAEAMARDPLGLRGLVLARLTRLLPAEAARLHRGQLVSADGRHLLLTATPHGSGSDTAQARKIHALLQGLSRTLASAPADHPGHGITLTAMGGYRAALDNETLAKNDTQRALIIATVGIALLLICCFPRPLLGLLALLPACAGLALGLFVFSLYSRTISALALGFGGALVSITVDHGIAYLLLLDRTSQTSGRAAARDVWSVGLFASLTTVGAFSLLGLSGFAILQQVGLVAALGVGFSFLFVHTVFPLIFPRMPAARRGALLPVERWLGRLLSGRRMVGPAAALVLALLLGLEARPRFAVDLAAMNSVTEQTLAAEKRVGRVWKDFFDRIYLLDEAKDLATLRRQGDRVAATLAGELSRGTLSGGLAPGLLLPGPERAAQNRAAWRAFWADERGPELARRLRQVGAELGFAEGAFDPFVARMGEPGSGPVPLPAELHEMLGIHRAADGSVSWLGTFSRGEAYRAGAVAERARAAGLAVFDPTRFTDRLSEHLGQTFGRMLAVIAAAVVVLLLVLFLDPLLLLLSLAPLAFALTGTLGVLHLIDHPIDIPGLMLVIVVFGMGVDYALFLVRSHQRFLDPEHPSLGPIRVAVVLAAGSTLVGMGSLLFADHAVPRSAGTTAAVGVGLSLLGALLILPPFLRRMFAGVPRWPGAEQPDPPPAQAARGVRRRYRHLDPYVRLFARFKLLFDPMFPGLHRRIPGARRLLDVGCGWGVPAAWLLQTVPGLRVTALEPNPLRARVARRVLGQDAEVHHLAAPELPGPAEPAHDAALLLDVVHHLSDDELDALLRGIRRRLEPGAPLVLRATVPSAAGGRYPWERRLEALRLRFGRARPHFRSVHVLVQALERAGFVAVRSEPAAPPREETWFEAHCPAEGEGPRAPAEASEAGEPER